MTLWIPGINLNVASCVDIFVQETMLLQIMMMLLAAKLLEAFERNAVIRYIDMLQHL